MDKNIVVRTTTLVQKNKNTKKKNVNNEHTMYGNEVRPIVSMSPPTEWLQFICINISSLGFTLYNLYLNTTVSITTLLPNRTVGESQPK